MVHLVLKDIFDQAYELTDRANAPRSSSALRYHSDAYSTFRFVARLPLTPDQWVQILNSTHQYPPHFHSSHPGEIYQAVAQAIMRGDLNIYQLPALGANGCLQGKKGFGLCLIQGPSPHSATDLTPEAIASPAAAQQLLDELGISSQAFLGYLTNQNLYSSFKQQNPLNEALQLLASGALLAYKIPLPPKAPPTNATEYLPPSAADKPVPLAPETSPVATRGIESSVAEPPASQPAPEPKAAQSLDECEKRLGDARERLITDGYQSKYTDAQLQALAQKGELDDRFVTRLTETKYAGDQGYLGQMKDGEVKYWSTTFNQMENADTDPKTLCALIGVDYKPENTYTLVIVDTQAKGAGQSATIVPTHKNLGDFAKREIKGINPKVVDGVMTAEYNQTYAEHMVTFKEDGRSIDKEKDIQRYADDNFSSNEDKAQFKTRMKVHERLGANEHYTGDGTTKNLIADCPNECGVMETFTYDKSPQTLGQLEASGSAKRITMTPL